MDLSPHLYVLPLDLTPFMEVLAALGAQEAFSAAQYTTVLQVREAVCRDRTDLTDTTCCARPAFQLAHATASALLKQHDCTTHHTFLFADPRKAGIHTL
jgi:hypothetical protein